MIAVVVVIIVIVIVLFDQHPHAVIIELEAEFTAVAVERGAVIFPVEKVDVEFHLVVEVVAAVQADHDEVVLGDVGGGKDGVAVIGQQFFGNRAVADQFAVAVLCVQVHAGPVGAITEAAVEVDRIGWRFVAPAVLLEIAHVCVITDGTVVAAAFRGGDDTFERTTVNLHAVAVAVEAVLHVHRQRAAHRVQAEQGVGAADQVNAVYSRFRQEVPVHRVPQRFVDAHAVLVHRHALGQAQQGRGGEAAVLYIRLQGIVLRVVVGDAGQVVPEIIGNIEALRTVDILC